MANIRLLTSLKIFFLSAAAIRAFCPIAKIQRGNFIYQSALSSVKPSEYSDDRGSLKMPSRSDFLAVMGSFVAAAVVSSAEPAKAAVMPNPCKWVIKNSIYKAMILLSSLRQCVFTNTQTLPYIAASSIYLSDEIKTIDLSLPSYDSINTLKADDKALGVEDTPEPKSRTKSQPKQKSDGNSGGLGSVLPSMNKSGPSNKPKPAKAKKEQVEKPKKPVKAEPKVEYETMDMALPSYSESSTTKERSVFSL